MQIESKEELGEWVGLCKIDKDGKPRKVVKCSCVVVKVSLKLFLYPTRFSLVRGHQNQDT